MSDDAAAPPVETAPNASPPAPEGDATTGGAAPQAPATPERRRYVAKVDGKEEAFELTESEVASRLTLVEASRRRFEEAARLRKEAEEKEARYRQNPKAFLQDMAPEARRQFLESELAEIVGEYQAQRMTPEERQLWEDRRELQQRREAEKQAIAEAEQRRVNEEANRWATGVAQSFQAALATSQVPQTKYTVDRMRAYFIEAQERGIEYSPQELAEQVRNDYVEDIGLVTGKMSGEQILSAFPALAQKVQQALLDRHRKGRQPQQPPPQTNGAPQRGPDGKFTKGQQPMTLKDLDKWLGLGKP